MFEFAVLISVISIFLLTELFDSSERFSKIVGSPYYMAPEVFKRNCIPEIDIWSARVVIVWGSSILGCGHRSFSDNPLLNSVVGHLLHSSILVPYHRWRISHRTHHQNHGHVENDESWVPLLEKIYKTLDESTKILRFKVPFPMFAYPIYLWTRSPGKTGSHFNGFPAFLPIHGVWVCPNA